MLSTSHRAQALSVRAARNWMPPLLLAVVGVWMIPLQHVCELACVPGDLGDARFNSVVLEHFVRWWAGLESSLLSPSFFHPMPGALAFSDNHLGTAWIYAAFRALGADRYQAFDLWYLSGFAVNFGVSHVVFRKLKFSPVASAVAAFAFTFALPVISKHGHAQLTYRFLMPLGLLLWQRCLEDGRWRWFAAVTVVVLVQFLVSIYLGYFLLLLLVAWTIAAALLDRTWPRQWLSQWRCRRLASGPRERYVSIALIVLAGIGLVALLYPYMHYAKVYRFSRALGEVATMTPRPQSYLLADSSAIWGALSAKIGAGIPSRQEHQLFFGLGLLGLAALGALQAGTRVARLAMVSLLLLFLLTITFDRYSLYLVLAALPGVGAVRAVARIAVVMALPLALLAATAIDSVPRLSWAFRLVVVMLVLIMGWESATYRITQFSIAEARERTEILEQAMPDDLPASVVVFNPLRVDEPYFVSELDGTILAQDLNRRTLNGYSGNYPPGYEPEAELAHCEQVDKRLKGAASLHDKRPREGLNGSLAAPVWVVGYGLCFSSAAPPLSSPREAVPAMPPDPHR